MLNQTYPLSSDLFTFKRRPHPLLEQFDSLMQDIKDRNLPVIVEGRNDKAALQEFGLHKIFTLQRPLFEIVEKVTGNEVIILTDLDTKGKQLYHNFHSSFTQRGVKVNNELRHFLMNQTPLAHIEGLGTFIRNIERR